MKRKRDKMRGRKRMIKAERRQRDTLWQKGIEIEGDRQRKR